MARSGDIRHERFDYPDGESLLQMIRSLALDIPFARDLSALFAPIDIAGRRVPNRFAVHPMEGADGDESGTPGALTFRRYRRFAEGGSGLIWFEAAAVRLTARSNPRQLCLTPKNADVFRKLVREVREAAKKNTGSDHEVLLILQLTHPGRYTKKDGKPAPVIAKHHPVLDASQKLPEDYPLIEDEELDRLKEDYARAALRAAEAGFDGVDVKACHGYLVSELLAARTREGSRYGGSFENRVRFLIETIERIRAAAPDLLVTSRINAFDGIPFPHGFGACKGDPGAADPAEPKALMKRLANLGLPLLNVSIGLPRFNPHLGRPFDVPLAGKPLPPEHPLQGVARLLRIAGMLQKAAPDLPVVGTGYSWLRHLFPHVGAGILEARRAAFIGIGRIAIAYPDCVKILMEKGALDPAKMCIGCSRCSQILHDGGFTGCVVRDDKIYGPIYREGRRRAAPGKKP